MKLRTPIGRFRIGEKGAGAEMRPAIVSGIVIGNFFSFSPVPSNSPRSLWER